VATPGARAEYARRLRRVLEYIDAHLAEPLALKDLAAVAHFSPYHFHRLFAAWMGETLGDHLRRRRLEVAAARLRADPALPVLNAALDVGFGSGEAFSRAFKQHFGSPPSQWRLEQAHSNPGQADGNPGQARRNADQAPPRRCRDDGSLIDPTELLAMNVTLIDLPPVHVAYLRYTGPYGPALSEFWRQRFMPWVHAQGLDGRTMYGISLDDPAVTPPEECRCDTAVEVEAGFHPPGDAHVTTLPGGRYALMRFEGSGAEIGDAWSRLFGVWLPDSGFQVDARPCFERYRPEDLLSRPGQDFACDLCLPVAPL
jgi:AraC family transcriptional regulator